MKELQELRFPEDIRYDREHEWLRFEGADACIGISDYAQDQLGDIVYVELPGPGDSFKKGEVFGTVESVKAVSELFMPAGGEILDVNKTLEDSPELVNRDPYGQGWMIRVKLSNPAEAEGLMPRDAYLAMLKG